MDKLKQQRPPPFTLWWGTISMENWEPSKHIQRSASYGNSEMVCAWAWVVKWKYTLSMNQHIIMVSKEVINYFMYILIVTLIFYVTFFITRFSSLFSLHHSPLWLHLFFLDFFIFFILAKQVGSSWIVEFLKKCKTNLTEHNFLGPWFNEFYTHLLKIK
jgi:hypothetical protein